MYLLMVIARTVKRDTATSPYRIIGNKRHRIFPCSQECLQKVEAAKGRLKQQNRRSERDKFMMNIDVALRTYREKRYIFNDASLLKNES